MARPLPSETHNAAAFSLAMSEAGFVAAIAAGKHHPVIATGIPDPATFARKLSLLEAEMLRSATRSSSGRRVTPEFALELRPLGLVDAAGRHLTAFGSQVRDALLREDA